MSASDQSWLSFLSGFVWPPAPTPTACYTDVLAELRAKQQSTALRAKSERRGGLSKNEIDQRADQLLQWMKNLPCDNCVGHRQLLIRLIDLYCENRWLLDSNVTFRDALRQEMRNYLSQRTDSLMRSQYRQLFGDDDDK